MSEIVQNIKLVIFLIGIGTIAYIIYQVFIKPTIKKRKKENEDYKFKIEALIYHHHPAINKLFEDFEQIQNKKYIESEVHHGVHLNKGGKYKIFNRTAFVFDKFDIKNFKEKIINKINELEQIDNSNVLYIIEKEKSRRELFDIENQCHMKLRTAETKYILFYCIKSLKDLFPISATSARDNEFTLKTKDEIIVKLNLITDLKIPYNNSDILFEKLLDLHILYKKTVNNTDYFYTDRKINTDYTVINGFGIF